MTVAKQLHKLKYSPKANARRAEARGASAKERDAQFEHTGEQRGLFKATSDPIISVDTKKELIGNFKNAGRTWCKEADRVLVHDWPQDAIAQAVPYGVYEVTSNRGYMYIGDCFDTPRFAVDAITDWWFGNGQKRYRDAHRLRILADAGGSNSYRSSVWKAQLQELSDFTQLPITVCHYPPGCSKWNPIEHRLFSQISINCSGIPLRTFETMLGYIEGTETESGLHVKAYLKRGGNETGERVTNEEWTKFSFTPHDTCPAWTCTFTPRPCWIDEDDQVVYC